MKITGVKKKTKKRKRNPIKKTKKRGINTMAKKKRSVKKRKATKRKISRKRRNPSRGFNFLDIIQQSLMAGVGGIGLLAGGNAIAEFGKLKGQGQKTLVRLAIVLASAYFLPRYMKREQAEPIVSGMMAILWISFLKSSLPQKDKEGNKHEIQKYLMLGDESSYDDSEIQRIAENVVMGEIEYNPGDILDMGEYEDDPEMADVMGEYEDY